jgi:hypothetical protein
LKSPITAETFCNAFVSNAEMVLLGVAFCRDGVLQGNEVVLAAIESDIAELIEFAGEQDLAFWLSEGSKELSAKLADLQRRLSEEARRARQAEED